MQIIPTNAHQEKMIAIITFFLFEWFLSLYYVNPLIYCKFATYITLPCTHVQLKPQVDHFYNSNCPIREKQGILTFKMASR